MSSDGAGLLYHPLGALIGISAAIGMFIGAFAPSIAGFIFDATESYSISFSILSLLLMACAVIAHILKNPQLSQHTLHPDHSSHL